MRSNKHGMLIASIVAALAWAGCSQLEGAAKKAGAGETVDKVSKSADEAKEKAGGSSSSSEEKSKAPEPKPPMKKTANVPAIPDDVRIQPAAGARKVEATTPDFCSGEFDAALQRTAEDAERLAKLMEKDLDYVQQDWAELACTYGQGSG